MATVEELQKSIVELKAKAGAGTPDGRALRKRLKRAQRRLRQLTGKKLATIRKHKKGGEEAPAAAAAPAAPPAPPAAAPPAPAPAAPPAAPAAAPAAGEAKK